MKYNRLGRTGLFVSEICFGTMTFSGGTWFGGAIGAQGQKEANALIEKSLAAGVNFIDTADAYSHGLSERVTGQAIRDLGLARSDVVLATKVFGRMGKGANDAGASRGHIMDGVAKSLERLKTDHIDLYQIHGTDPVTPVEETMRALDDLVRQGMVRYIGVSNWPAWRIAKANGIAGRHGCQPHREPAGLLFHRRTRPGTRIGAADAGRPDRLSGLESAGGRLYVGQIQSRWRCGG